jgi:uracil-xanthine permease
MMNRSNTSKFDLDGVPSLKEAAPLGVQHVLAMIFGNMVPAILLANIVGLAQGQSTMLIQCAMIAAAISTFIQLYPIPLFGGYKIGSRLPAMMGMSYVFLGACLSVTAKYGLATMFGAQLVGAIVAFFLGIGSAKIKKFFTPLISGIIVACMGIGLFPAAINNLAGGLGSETYGDPINFLVGGIVVLVIVLVTFFGKGLFKNLSILIGIAVGYIISLTLGMVDFSAVSGAAWFALPKPLAFGLEFRLDVIIMFIVLYIIGIADLMGSCSIITFGAFNRPVKDKELASTVIGNSVASIISSCFNALPTGIFTQNAAIVSMNKVVSRFVIAVAGGILVIVGLSPKVAAIMTTMPSAVVGGATLVVFSMIAMAGISLITMEGFSESDKLIAGVSITASIGLAAVPQTLEKFPEILQIVLGGSSIVTGTVIAIVLNLIYSKVFSKKKEGNTVVQETV